MNKRHFVWFYKDDTELLERKVKELERDLKQNYDIVKNIGKSVAELLKKTSGAGAEKAKIVEDTVESWNKQLDAKTEVDDCLFAAEEAQSKPDIQMLELYGKMKFDNPDGGVWKQGWDVQYNQDDFTEQNKLKVFVVPHSHVNSFIPYY